MSVHDNNNTNQRRFTFASSEQNNNKTVYSKNNVYFTPNIWGNVYKCNCVIKFKSHVCRCESLHTTQVEYTRRTKHRIIEKAKAKEWNKQNGEKTIFNKQNVW